MLHVGRSHEAFKTHSKSQKKKKKREMNEKSCVNPGVGARGELCVCNLTFMSFTWFVGFVLSAVLTISRQKTKCGEIKGKE